MRCALAVCLLLALGTPAVAQDPLERFRQAVQGLESYSARVETTVAPMEGAPAVTTTSGVVGRLPNRMALSSRMVADGTEVRWRMVFDGHWQWVEEAAFREGRLVSRTVKKVSAAAAMPGRPFDTFLYLSGTGLFAGEDLAGTFEQLLHLYRFEARGKDELVGSLDRVAWRTLLEARGQKLAAELLPSLAADIESVRLVLDPATGLPRFLAFSDPQGRETVATRILELEVNPAPGDDAFSYAPPAGWAVFDVTSEVLRQRPPAAPERMAQDLARPGEMPQALAELLDEGRLPEALAHLRAEPKLVLTADVMGDRPLHAFAAGGDPKALQEVIGLGAPVGATNHALVTALHVAAANGEAESVEVLLAAGADVDPRDADGCTPLHYAANVAVTRVLLKAGADRTLVTNEGQTPYEYQQDPEIQALLQAP